MQNNLAVAVKLGEPGYLGRSVVAPNAGSSSCNVHRTERMMEVCEAMIDICAALFNVPSKEIRQPGRGGIDVTRVRQIAIYVTHVTLGLNTHQVARGFARDRATVRSACLTVENLREDEDFDCTVSTTERVALAAFRGRLEV